MIATKNTAVDNFMQLMKKRNPHQPDFLQVVSELAHAIIPFIE
jgi:hypothetical protein